MKVAITGSSGLIGSAVAESLRSDGHDVLRLVRRTPSAPDEAGWDPTGGTVQHGALDDVDGVVHLAGAGVADHRWTRAYKRRILDSRVQGTRTISVALAEAATGGRPRVLLSASGIDYYGATGDRPVDESAEAGCGFLTDVVLAWESATAPATRAGIRVCHLRSGIVLSSRGGALARMLPIFRLGLGGRLGTGRQYWSWISLEDEARAIRHLLEHNAMTGPVNLTGPVPETNATVTRELGRVLGRPTVLAVPSLALAVVLGELSNQPLASLRVLPSRLLDSGFQFAHPDVETALRASI
jgi:uncharacterized protein (TIGR01777 family)